MQELIKVTTLSKQSHSAYYDLEYKLEDDSIQHYQMCSRNTNHTIDTIGKTKIDAVTMLITRKNENNQNEYLITKEFRKTINGYVLSFPAGIVENNENIIDASIREIKEETGISVTNDTIFQLERPVYSSPGIIDEVGAIIIVKLSGNEIFGNKELENSEDIETMWLTLNQLNKLLDEGYILGSHAYVHMLRLENK